MKYIDLTNRRRFSFDAWKYSSSHPVTIREYPRAQMNVFCPSSATSIWQEACDTLLPTVNRRYATSPCNSPALPPSLKSRLHHFPSSGHTTSARRNRGACRSRFGCGEQCAPPASSLLVSAFPKSLHWHRRISPNLDIAAAANPGVRHRFYGRNCLASYHGSLAAIPDVIFFDDTTRDLGVMFLALFLALAYVRLFDELARNNLLEQVPLLVPISHTSFSNKQTQAWLSTPLHSKCDQGCAKLR